MKKTKVMAIAATALMSISAFVYALPTYDEEYKYFSDATYSQVVGSKHVLCTGDVIKIGQQTSYRKLVLRTPCVGIIE